MRDPIHELADEIIILRREIHEEYKRVERREHVIDALADRLREAQKAFEESISSGKHGNSDNSLECQNDNSQKSG